MDRRKFFAAGATASAGFSLIAATTSAQAAGAANSRTIYDFGAVGDGVADDSAAFSSALQWSAQMGQMIIVPAGAFAIAKTIKYLSTGDVGSTWGLSCQGAKIISKIVDGSDMMSFTAINTVRYFRISGGLSLVGSGHDGHGLHIFAAGSSVYFYNALIEGVSIEKVGGHGLLLEGNVFETAISNSYFQDCKKNGATFAQSQGGVCSAISITNCFFNQNGVHGLQCTNFDAQFGGTTDVRVYGGYCRDNQSYGFNYGNGTGGTGAIMQVGFENNCKSLNPGDPNGAHVYGLSSMQLKNCGGYNMYGGATYLLRGWFNGLTTLDNCGQDAGGASAAAGPPKLVQVNGSNSGFVLARGCNGGIDVVGGSSCHWSAERCAGASPAGPMTVQTTISG